MGASVGVYVFINAVVFWAGRLKLGGFVASTVYLGYSVLISGGLGVLGGEYSNVVMGTRAELMSVRRHDWVHKQLGVRAPDLQEHQGGLR